MTIIDHNQQQVKNIPSLNPLGIVLTLNGKFHYSTIPSGGGDKHKQPIIAWKQYQTKAPTQAELQNWQKTHNPGLWGIL
ncbi:MAG: hypothetical protein HYX80_02465 [Chloroflexi bacterium]|nr:hypothetical protein [Chloroflexota bacterium]